MAACHASTKTEISTVKKGYEIKKGDKTRREGRREGRSQSSGTRWEDRAILTAEKKGSPCCDREKSATQSWATRKLTTAPATVYGARGGECLKPTAADAVRQRGGQRMG